MRYLLLTLILIAFAATAYDPLYYDNLTHVMPVTGTGGFIGLGYFHASQYWAPDSTGESHLYDFHRSNSVLRILAVGRYGLTSSHTLSGIIPAYVQLSGEGDSTGGGIADPWVSVDGWIERDPQVIGRAALRIPLKGYLESGEYSESDPHLALDGALTVEAPISGSGGPTVQATGGLRYYMSAWSEIPGSAGDSASTKPPVELRGTGFLVLPLNVELEFKIGLEGATRGETSAEIGGSDEKIEGSSFNYLDLRVGIDLQRSDLDLKADVYYRLSGENTLKEWGIMVTGLGLDFGDVFGVGGGRSEGGR